MPHKPLDLTIQMGVILELLGCLCISRFQRLRLFRRGRGGLNYGQRCCCSEASEAQGFRRSGGGNDIHDDIGYNFKFTESQACVGIEQMKKLLGRVERKKELWEQYKINVFRVSTK